MTAPTEVIAPGAAPSAPRARSGDLVTRTLSALALGVYGVVAATGSLLAPQNPARQDIGARLLPPGSQSLTGYHLLGTDPVGRDIWSMLIAGARGALVTAALAVAIGAVVGVVLGMLAGYYGGVVGDLIVYCTNTQLAFPFFLLALAAVGILGTSFGLVVVVLALGTWVQYARVIHAETQAICKLEYIAAVRVMRGSVVRCLLRHVLPNVLPTVIVLSTFALGTAIVLESGLGFIGLAPHAESPGWGEMLSDGRDYLATSWWITFFPGAAIFVVVLAVNLLGERMREQLDPRLAVRIDRNRRRTRRTAQ